MGSNSKSHDITGDSEMKEFKDISYKMFQLREYEVKRSDAEFRCPFCAIDEDDPSDYTHLLQHAIRVAEGSLSGKQRAKHSAMARYLAIDLATEVADKIVDVGDEEWLPTRARCRSPIVRKRSRSAGREANSAARTPPRRQANSAARTLPPWQTNSAARTPPRRQPRTKLAMAEQREKEALDKISELERKINEMTDEMNVLITKERSSNDELQLVRGELLSGLSDIQWANDAIGVMKIGELEPKVFIRELSGRYTKRESEIKGVELCSMWQEKIKDPQWYPFKIVEDDQGKPQRLLKEDDITLHSLKEEWGMKIHDAVVGALTDLQEHNSSGCYAVPELWNFGLKRKATLDEVIRHIIKLAAEGDGEPQKGVGSKL